MDERDNVIGAARRATPTKGGPADVAAEMAGGPRRTPPPTPESSAAASTGVGVGSPGTIEDGTVTSARNLPGWEGSFPACEDAAECARLPGARSATTCRSRPTPSSGSGPGVPTTRCSASSGAPASAAGLILEGKPWTGRGRRRGDRARGRRDGRGACTCGRLGCMEAYAGRASMEAHALRLHKQKGRKTDLFKLMHEHERTRLTSGIWSRALDRGDRLAEHMIDRAVRALGAGVASVGERAGRRGCR